MTFRKLFLWGLVWVLSSMPAVLAQSTTGSIQGVVTDEQKALIPGANVSVRHLETNATRTTNSDEGGRFRVINLPVGTYEVTVDQPGFTKYVRSGIILALNQNAVVEATLKVAGITEAVTVVEANASPLNVNNAEIGVMFDPKRISELPLATDRDVFSIALSAPGVSQLGSGQAVFASGPDSGKDSYSVNGMRVRSNNFMVDGQDSNDPSVTGRQQPINNPDIVQEIRLITNQFAAEYGRAAGSVMHVITKSGTNTFHGSAYERRLPGESKTNLAERPEAQSSKTGRSSLRHFSDGPTGAWVREAPLTAFRRSRAAKFCSRLREAARRWRVC